MQDSDFSAIQSENDLPNSYNHEHSSPLRKERRRQVIKYALIALLIAAIAFTVIALSLNSRSVSENPTQSEQQPQFIALPVESLNSSTSSPTSSTTNTNSSTSAPSTKAPTKTPTRSPTRSPSTKAPTKTPTRSPTRSPSTKAPTKTPTRSPTRSPSTKAPTRIPTRSPTKIPTRAPTLYPTTSIPTLPSFPVVNVSDFLDTIQLNISALYVLPKSKPNEVILLLKKSRNNQSSHDVPSGRSYDGYDWEAVFPLLGQFQCAVSTCSVLINVTEGVYLLVKRTASNRTSDQLISEFLTQATFGATRSSISSFPLGSDLRERAKLFLKSQINESETLHLAHYQRSNNEAITYYSAEYRGPCEIHSRWERSAYSVSSQSSITIVNQSLLYVDGQIRTVISKEVYDSFPFVPNRVYSACKTISGADGLRIAAGGACFPFQIPPMNLTSVISTLGSYLAHLNSDFQQADAEDVFLLKSSPSNCNQMYPRRFTRIPIVYARDSFGIWYRFSPIARIYANNIENPTSFPNYDNGIYEYTAKDFMNEEKCIPAHSSGAIKYSSAFITLNDSTLKQFYTLGTSYVYYALGLKPNQGPCASVNARFLRQNGICFNAASQGNSGVQFLSQLIITANNLNSKSIVVDVASNNDDRCSSFPPEIQIQIGGTCWIHVHNDLYSVFDFSAFSKVHIGGESRITSRAQLGFTNITYPHVGTFNWENRRHLLKFIGIFNSTIDFLSLPSSLQKFELAQYFGAEKSSASNVAYVEYCGRRGEVSNDPFNAKVQGNIFYSLMLNSKDQLRQRIAWALSQIFVVNVQYSTNSILRYHDIFIHHAFGNFFDIMKEVSYSPVMGTMLSYSGSQAYQRSGYVPDENYARELMQLFTIGLWRLNKNGTKIRDSLGNAIESYTNLDIQNFARVWTGFISPDEIFLTKTMKINAADHDSFPKSGLNSDYVGDEYPLCHKLPKQAFLQKGAKFRFTGSSNTPQMYSKASLLELNSSSSLLHSALCNEDPITGKCNFKSMVILPSEVSCFALECRIGSVKTVKVTSNAYDYVFYEYIPDPCVELEFPIEGVTTSSLSRSESLCVDKKSERASPVCCNMGSAFGTVSALYEGELTDFYTANTRCQALNKSLCVYESVAPSIFASRAWSSDTCSVQAQIYRDGRISLVHKSSSSWNIPDLPQLKVGSKVLLRVAWNNDSFPTPDNSCGGVCQVMNNSCLCDTLSTLKVVFSDKWNVPTPEMILRELKIGAVSPMSFNGSVYQVYYESLASGLTVYVDSSLTFNENTVFALKTAGSRVRYLSNLRAEVQIGGIYGFRNPPNFIKHEEITLKDVQYEIDAVLKHLLYHSNTAPFIADLLIKRFVTSNPSPAYIEAVADAFISGKYEDIGTGIYGDMSAAISATLLYRDAISSTLKSDMFFGKLREPLLSVLHLMRSLELNSKAVNGILANFGVHVKQEPYNAPSVFNFYVSEYQPLGSISDSRLFSPESFLYSYAAIIPNLNAISNLLDIGLVSCGKSFATGSLFANCTEIRQRKNPLLMDSYLNYSAFVTGGKSNVISQLDLLLTGGRLDSSKRNFLMQTFDEILVRDSEFDAVKAMIKLFIAAPEYHVVNMAPRKRINPVQKSFQNAFSNDPDGYRALIYMQIGGGLDSYNLLVPHSECGPTNLFDHYRQVRGPAALTLADLLVIDSPVLGVPASSTPQCQKFGIVKTMPNLRNLYAAKEAAFVSNVGALVEPLTKAEYFSRSKPIPIGLQAHNVQYDVIDVMNAANVANKGFLGRMQDVIAKRGRRTASYALYMGSASKALEGETGDSPAQIVIDPSKGISLYGEDAFSSFNLKGHVLNFTNYTSESIFADQYNRVVFSGMQSAENIKQALEQATLPAVFNSKQFEVVAKLISSRSRLNAQSDIFQIAYAGYDAHSSFGLAALPSLNLIDHDLNQFAAEMKRQGIWQNVTIVVVSEFGRTLRGNGYGTDHGWAGNTFVLGGSVKGGQILGKYPSKLDESGEMNVGNGILIPTTSWESLFHPICQWFGLSSEKDLNFVLPNRPNFILGNQLLSRSELYK